VIEDNIISQGKQITAEFSTYPIGKQTKNNTLFPSLDLVENESFVADSLA